MRRAIVGEEDVMGVLKFENLEIVEGVPDDKELEKPNTTAKGDKGKKKRSPRLKIAAKFNRATLVGKRSVKVQPGQSLISDHFIKTPSKSVGDNTDLECTESVGVAENKKSINGKE